MSNKSKSELDDAIRAYYADSLEDGEMIVSWVVVAGTRLSDDASATMVTPDSAVGSWQIKGLLTDALDAVRGLR